MLPHEDRAVNAAAPRCQSGRPAAAAGLPSAVDPAEATGVHSNDCIAGHRASRCATLMTRFPLHVWRTIRRYQLIGPGDRVLAACSAGPDSTALLFVLLDLAPRAGFEVAGVAHVHHGLRGPEADADLAFCRALAEGLGLPFRGLLVDVPGEAARRKWSMERTAHALRHQALRQASKEMGASRIAVGHTRDDQAETIVLRLLRGAGTRGMSGMWPRRGLVIRPLLDESRAAVEQFLQLRGAAWRVDATNADRGIPRNRVRHEVLPVLAGVGGPGVVARLARQADGWRDDERWLRASAAPWVGRTLERTPSGWRIRLDALEEAPDALRRRIRHEWLRALVPDRASVGTMRHLLRLERMREGRAGTLGLWRVQRSGAQLLLDGTGESPEEPATAGWTEPATLPVPGEVAAGPGWIISAERADRRRLAEDPARLGPDRAMLDADTVPAQLIVRGRRPGDRLRPIGVGGSQKVQDLLVNRKVPRAVRTTVPIVTTPDGRIAWVAGFAVDEEFAVKTSTVRVVTLKATRPGGKA
jgi:tRNA(Ile)-lysidine synthase